MGRWMTFMSIVLLGVAFPSLGLPQEKAQAPQGADPQQGELRVVRDAVATGISNREPTDPSEVFAPSLGRIYYFTEVRSPSPGTEIAHVWYYGEREVARITLPIDGRTWRTWSSTQVSPRRTGQWKVEAVTAEGTILASRAFSIESAPAAGPEKK